MRSLENKFKKYLSAHNLLFAILFLAFFVRFWGTNSPTYSDEEVLMRRVIFMIENKDWNPHFFSWPTFYFYLLAVSYLPYKIITFFSNPPIFSFFAYARFLSACLGTATVFAAYKIAGKLFTERIALFSALVLSLIFIHVVDSHYIILDVPMTFLTTLAFYVALGIINDGRPRNYLLTGFLVGLANATKYNFPLVLILPAAHFLHFWRGKVSDVLAMSFSLNLWKGIGFIVLGFIVGAPFALLDFKTFLWGASNAPEPEGLLAILFYVNDIRADFASNANGLSTPVWLISYLASSGLYYPFFLASVLGIVLLFRKINKGKIFLLFWIFLFLFVFSTLKTRFDRYLLPAILFLAIAGGFFLDFIFQKIGRIKMFPLRQLLFFLAVVFFFGISAFRVLAFDWLIFTSDTREETADWVAENYPKGTPILAVDDALKVGQKLQLKGFDNVTNLFPFNNNDVFLYPGEILIVDSANYHIAENYQNIEKYKKFWENYQIVKDKGELIKEFSRPLFKVGFFSPSFLEHSSTVNAYHNPNVEIYRIPQFPEIANRELSYEYLPAKMSTNGLFLKKGGSLVIMPRVESGLLIAGPHEVFPKGEYSLEYQLAEVKCLSPKGQIMVKITSSGGRREFAKIVIFCPQKGRIRIDLPVVFREAERLEFVLSSTPGIDFSVEKAVFKRKSFMD